MTTTHFSDGGGWESAAGYSRAVRRADTIAVSGTTAHAPDGTAMHPGDTYAQALECLRRVGAAIEALGGSWDDVVRTGVHLAPGADWEAAGRAHREVLGEVRPANTTLFVHDLIGEGFLVEIDAWAVVAS